MRSLGNLTQASGLLGLMGCLLLASASALAQPRFRPADGQVLLNRSVHSQDAALRTLDEARRARPDDQQAAVAYARAVFELGLTEGDLRWWGRARSALAPWWSEPKLSADGHFMRALVLQGFHEVKRALQDVCRAIELQPQRGEFWSWRFALNLLLSDMAAARQDCEALARQVSPLEAQPCRAILLYRTGQPQQALALLRQSGAQAYFSGPLAQDWLQWHLGEALRVAGQDEQAVAVWQAHLLKRPRSHAVRLALAESLNRMGRHAQAMQVARQDNPTDALLVQQLLASQGLRDGQTAKLAEQVLARWGAQDLRQESLIERPRMVFLIRYGHDVQAGLELAARNWAEQNEPTDGLLFLEAALRTGQVSRAQAVLDWAKATGYTEPALRELMARAQPPGGAR